jgi:microtubule-associated protein-like 6
MNNVTQQRFAQAPESASVVMQGHYQHELWGLCAHPTNPDLFVTTGDDRTMRTWSVSSRKQVQMASLPDLSRAVDWSSDGSYLALGLGGRVGGILRATSKEGKRLKAGTGGGVVVLNANDLSVVKAIKPESNKIKKWVSEVKFAPGGQRVAVGAHDSQVHVFDTRSLKRNQLLKKSSASITHVDWSADGNHIQTNDMSYELLFYNANTGAQITSPLKDETWKTWTCTLGWPVQGVWPSESDGTDVNSVDRSPDGTLVATGDDFSSVKLFRYPCVEPKSEFTVGKGHSSHVTNVRFSCDGKRLFTTGGNDRCVMQWRVVDAGTYAA